MQDHHRRCTIVMKQYVIDQLRPDDYFKIRGYLESNCAPAALPDIYWLYLPPDIWTDVQAVHSDCAPFYVALELAQTSLSCELLIRTPSRLRCDCMGYASTLQREWVIQTVDDMCRKLDISL